MELRHLRYFVSVAEQGSVSRAAQKLFIAQPALSTQIKQLEEEVGAQLLVRVPRGVQLTAAGVAFLEDARAILRACNWPQCMRVPRAKSLAAFGWGWYLQQPTQYCRVCSNACVTTVCNCNCRYAK